MFLKISFLFTFVLLSKPHLTHNLKLKAILEVTQTSLEIINTSIDIATKIFNQVDFEDKLKNIQQSLDSLHSKLDVQTGKLDTIIKMLNEDLYITSIHNDVLSIEGCMTDYRKFIANSSTSQENKDNVLNCLHKTTVDHVRSLGRFLTGYKYLGRPALFDIYVEEEGFCNGTTISAIFNYMFRHYVDGCTVLVNAAVIKYGQTSKTYYNECKDKIRQIQSYITSFYNKCAIQPCEKFHTSAEKTLQFYSNITSSKVYTILSDLFPWFEPLVIQYQGTNAPVYLGNFTLKNDDINVEGSGNFAVYYADSSIPIDQKAKLSAGHYYFAVEIQTNKLMGYFYGGLDLQKISIPGGSNTLFVGYANRNSLPCGHTPTIADSAPRAGISFIVFFTLLLQSASYIII